MVFRRRFLPLILLFLSLCSLLAFAGRPSTHAQQVTPTPEEGPSRRRTITVTFTVYEWWIIRWRDNSILCALTVEHEGLPFGDEVQTYCDRVTYAEWQRTEPCPQAGSAEQQQCRGVYMHLAGTRPGSREIEVDLPPPSAWVSLSGCVPDPPSNRCENLPSLVITGEEPLPNELVVAVHGSLAGEPFSCMGASCSVPLPATGLQGITVDFWVDSSFGDSSESFTALVRAMPWGNFVAPEGQATDPRLWYVDVISTQWRGAELASCSAVWESFPELGGPPEWLTTPERAEDLTSEQTLHYLAGTLIQSGEVNASECPGGGLLSPGVANACGLEKARPAVIAWQNQFDAQIIQVAKETGVPARLMKNVFSRESQFWPGIFQTIHEAGLGQMTENGADTLLLWNPSFFNQFCPLVFHQSHCRLGWWQMSENEQNLLKGALMSKVNAACPDCPAGIDLTKANFSINVFAESLLANCNQAGQIIFNTTNKSAGLSSTFEDLWRFTLVNYNAGPGCLSEAVKETFRARQPLNWTNIATRLNEPCRGAITYVEEVTDTEPLGELLQTPTVPPQATPPVQPTPAQPVRTPGSTPFPTPTPPVSGYPYPYPEPGPLPTLPSYP